MKNLNNCRHKEKKIIAENCEKNKSEAKTKRLRVEIGKSAEGRAASGIFNILKHFIVNSLQSNSQPKHFYIMNEWMDFKI